jgi:primary-amine oxidase
MHPLEPLSAEEIGGAIAVARRQRELADSVRFVSVMLREPGKDAVRDWREGAPVERVAELVLLDPAREATFESLVSIGAGST